MKLSDSKVISCFYVEWSNSYYSIFFDTTNFDLIYDYSGKITIEVIEGVFLIIKNNYCNIQGSSSDNNLKCAQNNNNNNYNYVYQQNYNNNNGYENPIYYYNNNPVYASIPASGPYIINLSVYCKNVKYDFLIS